MSYMDTKERILSGVKLGMTICLADEVRCHWRWIRVRQGRLFRCAAQLLYQSVRWKILIVSLGRR